MDFFTQQEKARRKTGLLVVSFTCAVVLIIAALYAAVVGILYFNKMIADPMQPELLVGIIALVLAIVFGGTFFKMRQLRKGGSAVAELLGGKPVDPNTRDLKEKQLLNVVEEMAIASGTPMPQVYILEESGINAFAAGWSTSDSAVCVTRGSLKILSRDELQGVIAHEFSHVLNGDMRLNIRLMGIIFGILVIGQIGYWVLRGAGRGRVGGGSKGKGGGAAVIFLIALSLLVIGYIGVFFGNLIQAAVSRAREYLADSSAVQFTRNPSGIGGALKKIGGLADGSRIMHHNASQASHFFFANGLSGFWSSVFATHPPLDKRIRAIEPGFDGEFPTVLPIAPAAAGQAAPVQLRQQPQKTAARPLQLDPAMLLAGVGSLSQQHVAYSAALINAIPNQVRLAMMDKNGAQAVIFSLLLSKESAIRNAQLTAIDKVLPAIALRMPEIEPHMNAIERKFSMPICTLAVNSLKNITPSDYPVFIAALKSLIEADNRIELFEYMIQRMVKRNLEPQFVKNVQPKRSISSIAPVTADCGAIFSILAWETSTTDGEAAQAFGRGAAFFKDARLSLVTKEKCSLQKLDDALGRLDQLVPLLKRQLLSACFAIVSADDIITVHEAEYLRVIADSLGCPMPVIIPRQE
jgi:Zn-dependent protease with chaperone function